jgi:hypothetical protein
VDNRQKPRFEHSSIQSLVNEPEPVKEPVVVDPDADADSSIALALRKVDEARMRAREEIKGDFDQAVQRIKGIHGVGESVLGYIRQASARIQAAVEKARSLGASEAQLVAVQAELDVTTANAEVVAQAVTETHPKP